MATTATWEDYLGAAQRLRAEARRTETGCLEVPRSGPSGYAQVKVKGERILAHRLVYAVSIGTSPDQLDGHVSHLPTCPSRACVALAHLVFGPPSSWRTRTLQCPQGHPYPVGKRTCPTCRSERNARYHAERKARQGLAQG